MAATLCFTFYKFARIRRSLGITRAMAASVSDHIWDAADISLLAG